MDNQRVILFVFLAIILLMIWQAWEAEHRPPPTVITEKPATADKSVPQAPTAEASRSQQTPVAAPVLSQGQTIHVTTDLLHASIDTAGGDLRGLDLLKHPESRDTPGKPFALMNDSDDEVFIAQSGLIGRDRDYPYHKTLFTAEQTDYKLVDGQDSLAVTLNWRAPDGVRYAKIYTFHRNSYVIDVTYTVDNATSKPWEGYLYGQFLRRHKESGGGLFMLPTYTGGAIYTQAEKYEKIHFDDMRDKDLNRQTEGGWVAMLQHYFVGAWMVQPQDGRNQFYSRSLGDDRYLFGFKQLTATEVAPGQRGEIKSQLFAGPKEHDRLVKQVEGMDLTVDFGWLTVISAPLFWLLVQIHKLVGNWGWAIILLTVLIKAVFFPLSAASYKSMAHMRRVQPRLAAIKERYGNDKQKFQQAMMEIYKTEKINPLGGCLPILIQIPVFIALYWVLLESVEMRHAPFALWINDLSSPDPYFVLPILMGVTMFAQQFLNPAPMDPIQKKIMMFMPLMFTVFFLFFPAGLVLYWVVNNILSIAQQWQITRVIESKGK